MPLLDGYSAAKKIKEALPNIPVLMFSTDTSPDIPDFRIPWVRRDSSARTDLAKYYWPDGLLAGGTYFPNGDHNSIS
jgi:CheY-like chemotaxis protein